MFCASDESGLSVACVLVVVEVRSVAVWVCSGGGGASEALQLRERCRVGGLRRLVVEEDVRSLVSAAWINVCLVQMLQLYSSYHEESEERGRG